MGNSFIILLGNIQRYKFKTFCEEIILSITIRIPPPLRKFTGGVESVETAAKTLPELFDGLESKFPGLKQTLCTPEGIPHRFVNVYVNDEDIRFLGGSQYAFKDGDEVLLVPAIAGGTELELSIFDCRLKIWSACLAG